MSGLAPEQQRALIACYGLSWQTSTVLLDDDGIKHMTESRAGGSCLEPFRGCHYSTDAKGIAVRRFGDDEAVVAVPWSVVRAHRKTIPPVVMAELRAAREECRAVQRDYPPFAASKEAQGCGRVHGEGPLTKAQALYAQEWLAYEADRLRPWYERDRAAKAREEAAIRAALPGLADEPADLLTLLESA